MGMLVIIATLTGALDGPLVWATVAASTVCIAAALAAQRAHVPMAAFVAALDLSLLLGIVAGDRADSPPSFAVMWMMNMAFTFPGLVLARRRERLFFSAVIVLVLPGSMYLAHPEWLDTRVIPAVVTGFTTTVVVAASMRALRAFAARFDDAVESNARERRAAAAARAAQIESAERARILHDTVINTLGAVASGGAAVRRRDLVRERCARDKVVVAAMLAGHGLPEGTTTAATIVDEVHLSVRRTGLTDTELDRVGDRIRGEVFAALLAAAREAVMNVERHADTDSVDLHIDDADGVLRIVVDDAGSGFDAELQPGRGLAESVVARCKAHSIDVSIASNVGVGTRVELRYPLDERAASPVASAEGRIHDQADVDFAATVARIRQRTTWAWALGLVVVGVIIEAANRIGHFGATYGMLAVGAGCLAISWWDVRRRGAMSAATQVLVATMVPVAFVLALAGTDFGRVDVIDFQALGVTAPLLLLGLPRSRVLLALSAVALVVVGSTAAVTVASESTDAALIILIGMVPPIWLTVAWLVFLRAVERVGERSNAEQQALLRVRAQKAEVEAAASARERWMVDGLRDCATLLHDLASGDVDPADPEVREACAVEERYLRQLILLNPALFNLGFWLERGLRRARARHVRFAVRTGGIDVDQVSAGAFGDLVVEVVEELPFHAEVTVSIFATDRQLRFAVVGPVDAIVTATRGWTAPPGWRSTTQNRAGLGAVEVVRDEMPQLVAGGGA